MTTYTTKPSPMHSGHDIRDERGHMVAIVHNPAANRAEGARIAALMAAAPELLAALEEWVGYVPNSTDEVEQHRIDRARAAIARATATP